MGYTEQITQLKESPLFALSLCSKELAHSNMWKWLMDTDREFAKAFFDNIDINNIYRVERESGNRDISIWMKDDSCYVIENKLKSIPTEQQINEYQDELGDKFVEGLLTGAIPTLSLSKLRWYFKSYEDISDRIREINATLHDNQSIDDYLFGVVNCYCDEIQNISSLITGDLDGNYPDNHYYSRCIELKDIKLYDIFLKHRAERFVRYIEKQPDYKNYTAINKKGWELKCSTGFSHGEALIDIAYVKKDKNSNKKEELYDIGVQIQGNEFRVRVSDISTNRNKDIIFNCLKSAGLFEDFNKTTNKIFRNNPTSMKGNKDTNYKYCKFVTDKYIAVYQYYNIKDGISYDELWCQIKTELDRARIIVENDKWPI